MNTPWLSTAINERLTVTICDQPAINLRSTVKEADEGSDQTCRTATGAGYTTTQQPSMKWAIKEVGDQMAKPDHKSRGEQVNPLNSGNVTISNNYSHKFSFWIFRFLVGDAQLSDR